VPQCPIDVDASGCAEVEVGTSWQLDKSYSVRRATVCISAGREIVCR